jgi:hypothetical protein
MVVLHPKYRAKAILLLALETLSELHLKLEIMNRLGVVFGCIIILAT